MKLRLRRSQIIKAIRQNAPDYLKLLNDYQASDGGWLVWPEYLVKIKANLKIDNYVMWQAPSILDT